MHSHCSPDSKRSEALASQLQAAHARERTMSEELKQLQKIFAEMQQKQEARIICDDDADLRGKRQRVRQRLQRVTHDVSDLNLLLKNLSEGKNVPMALLVQDKRHSLEHDASDADEEVNLMSVMLCKLLVTRITGAAGVALCQRCVHAAPRARTGG